ncbi:hypothetical protein CR513_52680, partial [Mucuna pruriens]
QQCTVDFFFVSAPFLNQCPPICPLSSLQKQAVGAQVEAKNYEKIPNIFISLVPSKPILTPSKAPIPLSCSCYPTMESTFWLHFSFSNPRYPLIILTVGLFANSGLSKALDLIKANVKYGYRT